MNNDEAREAALKAYYLGYAPATDQKREVAAYRAAWDACMAHLRASGQLCTGEERAVLKAMAQVDGNSLAWFSGGATLRKACLAEIARRAKGEADGGA